MRKASFLVVLVAIGAAVSVAAAAATDPHAEKKQLTKADTASAARAVLRRADLAAQWTSTTPSPFDQKAPECAGYDPDFSAFTITGRAHSAFKRASGAMIQSEVDVFKTAADARADFRLGAQPILADCLSTVFAKELQAAGVDIRVLSSRMSSTPRIGERAAFYHLVFELTASGQQIPFYLDVVAFVQARTIAALFFASAVRPLPGELQLVRAVAARTAG